MAWIYLFIAGVFEIGWPLGFKLSVLGNNKYAWIAFAALSMALSGFFLWKAQNQIPIGTAYAVWTGIGALGTFIIGISAFSDPVNPMRLISFMLILIGVIGMKIF